MEISNSLALKADVKEPSGMEKPLSEIKFCYVGDARNNMGNSLMVGAAKLGIDFRAAAPLECQPSAELQAECLINEDCKAIKPTSCSIGVCVYRNCEFEEVPIPKKDPPFLKE